LKNDPTIMAWETGHELYNARGGWDDSWTETIAEYIKSIAPNQLFADGHHANYARDLTVSQLNLPSVDLYTSHFYHTTDPVYISQLQTSANLAKQHNKVYYIGEFDWTSMAGTPNDLQSLLSLFENPTYNVSGDTYWDLADNANSVGPYTMHWSGDNADMQQRAQLLANHAAKMSASSATTQPTAINLIQTGSFEHTGSNWLSPWTFRVVSPAQANISQVSWTKIDGNYAASVVLTNSNSNAWYMQLGQDGISLKAGKTYTIVFWAKASKNRQIHVLVEQGFAPYAIFTNTTVNLTTNWQPYTIKYTQP